MRSNVLTKFATGGAVLVLSIWATASGVLAEAPDDAGRSSEHRNDASAHEAHGQQAGNASAHAGDSDPALDQPQPASNADFSGNGANEHGPYDSTRDGSPSDNGNGEGAATGEPCAGCVGHADNKNPAGQLPGPSDANNGYECDGNSGIARGNPAHTGCTTASELNPGEVIVDATTLHTPDAPGTPASVLGVTFTAPVPVVVPAAVLPAAVVAPAALAATGSAIDLGRLAMVGLGILLAGVALRLGSRRQSSPTFA